jgi:hypothetical protein
MAKIVAINGARFVYRPYFDEEGWSLIAGRNSLDENGELTVSISDWGPFDETGI